MTKNEKRWLYVYLGLAMRHHLARHGWKMIGQMCITLQMIDDPVVRCYLVLPAAGDAP